MIELSEVIRQLRSELDHARDAAEGEELRFELGPIDVEVTVGLEREGGTGGKIRFWVAELGADARVTTTSTQRIKLTLEPALATTAASAAQTVRVKPYVAGPETRRER